MKNLFKKLLIIVVLLLVIAVIYIFATGNGYIFTAASNVYLRGHTTANIYDENVHTANLVATGKVQEWQKHPKYNSMTLSDSFLEKSKKFKIKGLLVIKDGKLVFEKYWDKHTPTTKSNSFSLAKTVNTMLIGAAIDDGFIKSLEQPITDFLPELKNDKAAQKVTIRDLAAMTSGFDWDEHYYNVLNPTTKAYYGKHIEKQMLERKFIPENYGKFYYSSGSSQMLGIVLHRAIKKPLAEYLSEKIWQPVGMEYPATWSLDRSDELEKTYCCLNVTLRDFGKLGQFYLDNGSVQRALNPEKPDELSKVQIISEDFIKEMHKPNPIALSKKGDVIYGLSTWLDVNYQPNFYAMLGHLGQRIIMVPSENLVVVRIGELRDGAPPKVGSIQNQDIYYILEEARSLLKKANIE